jgi:hypothetical protein
VPNEEQEVTAQLDLPIWPSPKTPIRNPTFFGRTTFSARNSWENSLAAATEWRIDPLALARPVGPRQSRTAQAQVASGLIGSAPEISFFQILIFGKI